MVIGTSLSAQGTGLAPDPEAGSVPTLTLNQSANVSPDVFQRTQSIGLAMDFVELDGVLGGILFELGGTSSGAYIGFRSDGRFIARAGAGEAYPNPEVGLVELPKEIIHGNGTLFVNISMVNNLEVTVFWNGWQQTDSHQSVIPVTHWAGTGNGAYLSPSSIGKIPQDEYGDVVPSYSWASPLRVYQ